MKGKIGIVLGVCLLVSVGELQADMADLAKEVILGAAQEQMPKLDTSKESLIVGTVVTAAGIALYQNAETIAPDDGQVKMYIEKALCNNAYAQDFLRGLGVLGTGAGLATFLENGPAHRRTMAQSFVGIYCYSQLETWGQQEKNEVYDGAVKAVLSVPVLNSAAQAWRSVFSK